MGKTSSWLRLSTFDFPDAPDSPSEPRSVTDSISFAAERERKPEGWGGSGGGLPLALSSCVPFARADQTAKFAPRRPMPPSKSSAEGKKGSWEQKKKKGCSEGTDPHLQTIGRGAKVSLGRDVNRSPAPPSLSE